MWVVDGVKAWVEDAVKGREILSSGVFRSVYVVLISVLGLVVLSPLLLIIVEGEGFFFPSLSLITFYFTL